MTSEDAFRASLTDFARLNNDLARWLNTAAVEARGFSDARAARMGVTLEGCSKAAAAAGNGVLSLFNNFDTYINDTITSGGGGSLSGTVHTGSFTRTFPTAGNYHNVTVSPLAWVTASTFVVAMVNVDAAAFAAAYPGTTYEFGVYHLGNVVGTSFQLQVVDRAAPVSFSYQVDWIAFS